MKRRSSVLAAAILLSLGLAPLGLTVAAWARTAGASATAANSPQGKKSPSPSPTPSHPPSPIFVKAYGAVLNGALLDLSPVDVQSTSDGGYIALAETTGAAGGASWLVKLSATGTPQWQEELGCSAGAPGDYAEGLSVEQTADAGFIVGGGTVDCGSGSSCPSLSGRSCALAEKLDAAGRVSWARVYAAGPGGSDINQIRQTADGGYIAAGSATDAQQNPGAMILKLDSSGNVQWQQDLGPAGSTGAYFNAVRQTADGGYVAAGDYYSPAAGPAPTQVLVARFGADGSLAWQHGFATVGSGGTVTSVSDATSVISTSDGGYAISGTWSNAVTSPSSGARGALLIKLDASGNLQWQQAFTGGVYCYDNGYSETCADIGAVSYSVHQTSDGGYVMAGDGDLELTDETPLVPWQAKADANGNLLWQHFYYQTYTTGRPLSEFFAASAPAAAGGSWQPGSRRTTALSGTSCSPSAPTAPGWRAVAATFIRLPSSRQSARS